MDAATFAAEHGCNEEEAALTLELLPPSLAAELFVRCRHTRSYRRRQAIARDLLRRAGR